MKFYSLELSAQSGYTEFALELVSFRFAFPHLHFNSLLLLLDAAVAVKNVPASI